MSIQTSTAQQAFDPVEALRNSWLSRRLLVILLCCSLLLTIGAAGALYWGANPPIDAQGRLMGLDFSALWSAGRAGLNGDFVSSYSLAQFVVHMQSLFGDKAQVLLWAYPPIFYFVVVPLATLPYGLALALWLGATFAALALSIRRILPQPLALLAIAAFPGIFGNAIHGQTGFLTAALFAGALVALPGRPVLSGILFACLAYKPQYGLLIPLALAVAGQWRAFSAASVTLAVFLLGSLLVFGWESWVGFFASVQEMRSHSLGAGENGYHILQSAFAALRLHGAPATIAWTGQALVAAYVAGGIILLWRSGADQRLKAAGLVAAALALTPYCLDYDLVVLGPAIAFFVSFGLEKGFRAWDHTLLALAFIAPPLARYAAFFAGIPLGLIAILGIFTIVITRAKAELDENAHISVG